MLRFECLLSEVVGWGANNRRALDQLGLSSAHCTELLGLPSTVSEDDNRVDEAGLGSSLLVFSHSSDVEELRYPRRWTQACKLCGSQITHLANSDTDDLPLHTETTAMPTTVRYQ